MKKKQSHRRKINRKLEKRYKREYGIEIHMMPPRQVAMKPKGRREIREVMYKGLKNKKEIVDMNRLMELRYEIEVLINKIKDKIFKKEEEK